MVNKLRWACLVLLAGINVVSQLTIHNLQAALRRSFAINEELMAAGQKLKDGCTKLEDADQKLKDTNVVLIAADLKLKEAAQKLKDACQVGTIRFQE